MLIYMLVHVNLFFVHSGNSLIFGWNSPQTEFHVYNQLHRNNRKGNMPESQKVKPFYILFMFFQQFIME